MHETRANRSAPASKQARAGALLRHWFGETASPQRVSHTPSARAHSLGSVELTRVGSSGLICSGWEMFAIRGQTPLKASRWRLARAVIPPIRPSPSRLWADRRMWRMRGQGLSGDQAGQAKRCHVAGVDVTPYRPPERDGTLPSEGRIPRWWSFHTLRRVRHPGRRPLPLPGLGRRRRSPAVGGPGLHPNVFAEFARI